MSAQRTMNEVIRSHNLMHIATIDDTGCPSVRGVDYAVGNDNTLYFMTHKDSRKVEHLSKNNQVAIAIDEDCPEFETLAQVKYIKASGTAAIIESPEEMQQAMALLTAKFPFLSDLPGDPDDFAGIRVTLEKVLVTDNTISFGHTEEIIL